MLRECSTPADKQGQSYKQPQRERESRDYESKKMRARRGRTAADPFVVPQLLITPALVRSSVIGPVVAQHEDLLAVGDLATGCCSGLLQWAAVLPVLLCCCSWLLWLPPVLQLPVLLFGLSDEVGVYRR